MNNSHPYLFELGQKVYAIGTDMDAVFVGRITQQGQTKLGLGQGSVNAYKVSNPHHKDDVFLEDGLISAETAYAMIGGVA
jgi:hypothetical protein